MFAYICLHVCIHKYIYTYTDRCGCVCVHILYSIACTTGPARSETAQGHLSAAKLYARGSGFRAESSRAYGCMSCQVISYCMMFYGAAAFKLTSQVGLGVLSVRAGRASSHLAAAACFPSWKSSTDNRKNARIQKARGGPSASASALPSGLALLQAPVAYWCPTPERGYDFGPVALALKAWNGRVRYSLLLQSLDLKLAVCHSILRLLVLRKRGLSVKQECPT